MVLSDQLDMYIIVLRNDNEFFDIEGIISLAEKMIKKKIKIVWREFFKLILMLSKLSLLLSVATNTVKRVYFVMHIFKNKLWNRMRDKRINNSLIVYIGKDIFNEIDNEIIMKRFQNMKLEDNNFNVTFSF